MSIVADMDLLLDGKQLLVRRSSNRTRRIALWILFHGLVDPAICARTDETYDIVFLAHFDLGSIVVA
jgi:hypothetical protein